MVGMFCACSSDTVSAPDYNQPQDTPSSSNSAANSNTSGNGPVVKDSIVHETVYLSSSGKHIVPYSSNSEAFCWDDKDCKAATPTSSSAMASIEINMSSEAQNPPTVNGTTMTDNRDGKSYKLENVGGRLWMAENLNFQTKSGYFCKTASSEDMCATYGGFYTYSGAQRACPSGWRLPTQAEVTALDAAVKHEWWQVGGRFKLSDDVATDYGLEDEQGYIWIQADGEYSSFRIKNYNEDSPHEFQSGSTGERAYNVRCISDQ